MTTVNRFLGLEPNSAANGAMTQPRSGKARHPGKTPEFFPDVLASLSPAKKPEGGDAMASGKIEATSTPDGEADDGGAESLPPEEKIQQTNIPIEVKQYLQNLVAIEQKRAIAADTITPSETVADPLAPSIASTSISGAPTKGMNIAVNAKAGESEGVLGFEKSPNSMSNFERPGFHEPKIMSPGDSNSQRQHACWCSTAPGSSNGTAAAGCGG